VDLDKVQPHIFEFIPFTVKSFLCVIIKFVYRLFGIYCVKACCVFIFWYRS